MLGIKKKVFVSYTVRDGFITRDYLLKLEKCMSNKFNVYIDLLHNDSSNPQKRVIKELIKSDIFLLIYTKEVFNSPWVLLELNIAIYLKIPIITYNPLL